MIQKVITRKFKDSYVTSYVNWEKKRLSYLKCGHDSAIMLTRTDASCLVYNKQYSDKEETACRVTGITTAP